MKNNVREIKTYDGREVRSRNRYEDRVSTEVRIGKLYQCMDCGAYMKKNPEEHICNKTQ